MIKRPNTLIVRVFKPQYESTPLISKGKWAAGLSIIVGSSIALSHTLFKDVRRYFVEVKREGITTRPSDKVLTIVQRAMDDLKYSTDEKQLVKVVVGSSFLPKTIGSIDTIFGSYLVVPDYINAHSPEPAPRDIVQLFSELGIAEEDLVAFQDTYKLSDNAKLYSVARELTKSRICFTYLIQSLAGSIVTGATFWGIMFLDKSYLALASLTLKTPAYSICAVIGSIMFQSVSYLVSAYEDEKSEHVVSNLGEKYISGGIEYCEKAIKRKEIFENIFSEVFVNPENSSPLSRMSYSDRLSLLRQKGKQ